MKVPEKPGVGIDPDESVIRDLQAAEPVRFPRHISTVVYPSGTRWHFANEQQRHEWFYFGHLPGFVPGVRLDVLKDDGSKDFAGFYQHCSEQPVVEHHTGEPAPLLLA